MPHTRISDQISTENSFYGIDYQDYIDESNNFTDERKRFSEIRKMKVTQEVLPLLEEIHQNTLNTKIYLEKNKNLITNLLKRSKKYIDPSEKSLDNLLKLEIKLGTILDVSNESIFKDYKPEIIPKNYEKIINENKYAEMIIKLLINYNIFEFNTKGDITYYWCSDIIKVSDKGNHKTLNGLSDFEYTWNEKSPLNFVITNTNKKVITESLKLIFRLSTELNHFKQYITNSKLDDKCPSYNSLKTNIQAIKSFYEKIKEDILENKNISKETKKVRTAIFNIFQKPLLFIESFIILEDYKNYLSKGFSLKVKNKNINAELKKIIEKKLILNKYNDSDDKNIKEEQEKILNRVLNKSIHDIKSILHDAEPININDLKLFYTIFSENETKDLYNISIKDVFKVLENYFIIDKASSNNNPSKGLPEKLPKYELNKFNIIFDINVSEEKIASKLNELFSKKDSPIIKSLIKILIICRILKMLEQKASNNIINAEQSLIEIYEEISNEFMKATYMDNIYYFSFFDILEKLIKKVRIDSLSLLNSTINNLTVNTPPKLKNHIIKKKLKPKELESYISEYNDSILKISHQINMQKKYIYIFEKIINLVNNKIEKYSNRVISKDVQKKMIPYSNIVLNKDPRNIPKLVDWNWILNVIYSSQQDNSFSDSMLKSVYDFIEAKIKNKSKSQTFNENIESVNENILSEHLNNNADKTVIIDKNVKRTDIKKIDKITLPRGKKFKDLDKGEQDNILDKIVNSPDLHQTKFLNSLGISSADIIAFVLRQKEKKS